jgi:tRNA (mo5U34)-methyltransferase
MSKLEWFHRIDLGDGVITPGRNKTAPALARRALPMSFTGKTVLDVGAWDGLFSFEAERRGARRVLATDHFVWVNEAFLRKPSFEFARRALGSRVEDLTIEAADLSPTTVGVFDVVIFFGVLYHRRDPLQVLERVASVTGETLLLETHIMNRGTRPMLEFYPGGELRGDATNWFGPNRAAVEAMLRDVGFKHLQTQIWRPNRAHRLARAVRDSVQRGLPFRTSYDEARLLCVATR